MNCLQKILVIILVACVPLAAMSANHKKKKKKTKATVTHVANPSQKQAQEENVTSSGNIQKDTTEQPKVVTITSSFKPSLRNAAKINFTAATPVMDTTRIQLSYNIPSQNLFFSYQPVSIKPLALSIDSSYVWENDRYIKVGYGNYRTPYLETGLAFGDGETSIMNVHAKHVSSIGKLPFQQYGKTDVKASGIFNNVENNELTGNVAFDNSVQYKYGYQPSTLVFSKDQLKQEYNNIALDAGLKNKVPSNYDISYSSKIKTNYFFDNHSGHEFGLGISASANKLFGKAFAFDLGTTVDLTTSKVGNPTAVPNNLYFIDPSFQFKTPDFKLSVGIQPSWNNKEFFVLPNITTETKIKNEKFIFQAGWVGYYIKNTYQSLTAFNPWIDLPSTIENTRVREEYAGIKGSIGKHFNYNGKVSLLQFNDQPLFVNDTAALNTQSFKVLFESQMQALRLHGELGYSEQEKLSVIASATYTQYTKQITYDRPYGLLPLELNGMVRYKVYKDIIVTSDVSFWDGTHYQGKNLQSFKLSPAMDLNMGSEFSIFPKWNIWFQLNNLLNDHYQRWNQYQVLGFNVVGGVVYSF